MAVKRLFLYAAFAGFMLVLYGAAGAMGAPKGASLGSLPAIEFYDKSGQKLTLAHFKGKVVLVNLWATWCTPCLAELPSLDKLQGMLPEKKFSVVAISLDRNSIGNFFAKKRVKNLEPYWDKERQVPLKWKYQGLPTSFLLDREGNVLKQYDGPAVWDQAPVLDEIKDIVLKK